MPEARVQIEYPMKYWCDGKMDFLLDLIAEMYGGTRTASGSDGEKRDLEYKFEPDAEMAPIFREALSEFLD